MGKRRAAPLPMLVYVKTGVDTVFSQYLKQLPPFFLRRESDSYITVDAVADEIFAMFLGADGIVLRFDADVANAYLFGNGKYPVCMVIQKCIHFPHIGLFR